MIRSDCSPFRWIREVDAACDRWFCKARNTDVHIQAEDHFGTIAKSDTATLASSYCSYAPSPSATPPPQSRPEGGVRITELDETGIKVRSFEVKPYTGAARFGEEGCDIFLDELTVSKERGDWRRVTLHLIGPSIFEIFIAWLKAEFLPYEHDYFPI